MCQKFVVRGFWLIFCFKGGGLDYWRLGRTTTVSDVHPHPIIYARNRRFQSTTTSLSRISGHEIGWAMVMPKMCVCFFFFGGKKYPPTQNQYMQLGTLFCRNTCGACIRTRANTGKYFWGFPHICKILEGIHVGAKREHRKTFLATYLCIGFVPGATKILVVTLSGHFWADFQGEIMYAPPPPFLAKNLFSGEGSGGVYSEPPRGRNFIPPPPLYTPPTPRRVFLGVEGGGV